ncbi:MAG: DUF3696 domain-containing protein [Candidatus Eremiobacteraeota bacterium]|nr:DUF3696 domain-containing protein [Candidatus Eremiobacteraeota bacterium]
MIHHLSLENFKGWRSLDALTLAPLTGLFGTNSSGKSSIIQSLLLMKQTTASADRRAVFNVGGKHDPVQFGSIQAFARRGAAPGALRLGLEWGLPDTLTIPNPVAPDQVLMETNVMNFCVDLDPGDGNGTIAVEEMQYQLAGQNFSYRRSSEGYQFSADFDFKRSVGKRPPLPPPDKFYGFPDQVRAYYQNVGFLADLELEFERLFERLYYLGPLRGYPQRLYEWTGSGVEDVGYRGEKTVEAILSARKRGMTISRGPGRGRKAESLEQRVAHWLKEWGLVHNFSVEEVKAGTNLYEVLVQSRPQAESVLLPDVGFGVSQLLPVIVLCYFVPEGSIVLLEQPEIHLHPSVQSGLADLFLEVTRTRGIQLIIESHSEHLLTRLQRRLAENEDIPEGHVALHFCKLGSDGESTHEALRLDQYGNIQNWPENFFGDTFADRAAQTKAVLDRRGL